MMIPGNKVGLYTPGESEYRVMVDLRNANAEYFFTPGHITLKSHYSFMQQVNADPAQLIFTIRKMDDDKATVGVISLYDIDYYHQRAEYGRFVIAEAERGQGFGTEALYLLLRYGFDELKLRRIHGEVLASNEGALSICRKLEMWEEGRLFSYVRRDKRWHDVSRMAISRGVLEPMRTIIEERLGLE